LADPPHPGLPSECAERVTQAAPEEITGDAPVRGCPQAQRGRAGRLGAVSAPGNCPSGWSRLRAWPASLDYRSRKRPAAPRRPSARPWSCRPMGLRGPGFPLPRRGQPGESPPMRGPGMARSYRETCRRRWKVRRRAPYSRAPAAWGSHPGTGPADPDVSGGAMGVEHARSVRGSRKRPARRSNRLEFARVTSISPVRVDSIDSDEESRVLGALRAAFFWGGVVARASTLRRRQGGLKSRSGSLYPGLLHGTRGWRQTAPRNRRPTGRTGAVPTPLVPRPPETPKRRRPGSTSRSATRPVPAVSHSTAAHHPPARPCSSRAQVHPVFPGPERLHGWRPGRLSKSRTPDGRPDRFVIGVAEARAGPMAAAGLLLGPAPEHHRLPETRGTQRCRARKSTGGPELPGT